MEEELKKVFFSLSKDIDEVSREVKFEIIEYMLKIYKAIYHDKERSTAESIGN